MPEPPSPQRREFYERLAAKGAKPLWEVLGSLIPSEPRPACQPVLWRYDELRPLLLEAGQAITAQEAGRRVLILENPGLRGVSTITGSLYAGLQLVMPGEVTSIHRHTATAVRFILESEGGYTAVNGERAYMRPGDFIVTPSWTAHDHGNPGPTPVVWLDVLDVPIVNLFDSSFAEDVSPGEPQPPLRGFAYPYAINRGALAQLVELDPCHGAKMFYDISQGYPMPTMAAFLERLPEGFRGRPWRSTDATIYCCAEGSGRTHIGGETFEWNARDVFVIPPWSLASHETDREAVLFGISDRPAQQSLGLWRELR